MLLSGGNVVLQFFCATIHSTIRAKATMGCTGVFVIYGYQGAEEFLEYIRLLCYKQPVSIYKGKSNNVGKSDEDQTWLP